VEEEEEEEEVNVYRYTMSKPSDSGASPPALWMHSPPPAVVAQVDFDSKV